MGACFFLPVLLHLWNSIWQREGSWVGLQGCVYNTAWQRKRKQTIVMWYTMWFLCQPVTYLCLQRKSFSCSVISDRGSLLLSCLICSLSLSVRAWSLAVRLLWNRTKATHWNTTFLPTSTTHTGVVKKTPIRHFFVYLVSCNASMRTDVPELDESPIDLQIIMTVAISFCLVIVYETLFEII